MYLNSTKYYLSYRQPEYNMKNSLPFFFSILLLSACSYKDASAPYPEINTFKKGERLRVNLPENHNNKENWLMTSEHLTALKHLNAVWHGNEKGIDFNFEAVKPGTDTLTFVLRQIQDTLKQHRVIVQVTE